ncbi:aldolase [Aspergillus undulatus]|uniref:aldolase n=1 Tax=Aspergillus undulatus TaxID=1810928 RepID=UPI003CCE2B5A
MEKTRVNLLEYLRSKTQVDLDTFDVSAVNQFGQLVDCTSNQYQYYTELLKPHRKAILQKTLQVTSTLQDSFTGVPFEELAVEVGAVLLAHEMLPTFSGNVHVMANPSYAFSKEKTVEAAKRYYRLFALISPSFSTARIVIKVSATWEGLQACRELHALGIKTLGTCLFTMEQAVLAGEAGCVSISPFVNELRIMIDPEHKDPEPLLDICVQAQRWYERKSIPTKVKACATVGVEQIIKLAGVAAFTIEPDDLRTLQSTHWDAKDIEKMCLFATENCAQETVEYGSYIDDEAKFRADFARADEGKAQRKLIEAIGIFSGYQVKAEALIRDARVSGSAY